MTQTPGMRIPREALLKRKNLISKAVLTGIAYFSFEIMFHLLWDMHLSRTYSSLWYSFFISVTHEIVDMVALISLLNFIRLNSLTILQEGEAMIDLSNFLAASNIELASKITMYKAKIPFDFEAQDSPDLTNPVIVVGPTISDDELP
jgi:hypothetical protein